MAPSCAQHQLFNGNQEFFSTSLAKLDRTKDFPAETIIKTSRAALTVWADVSTGGWEECLEDASVSRRWSDKEQLSYINL